MVVDTAKTLLHTVEVLLISPGVLSMWQRLKRLLLTRLRFRETWILFFVFGVIMLNYPFISIFNKTARFFEIPLLYLYLQIGWAISIFVIWLFNKANDHYDRDGAPEEGP